MSLLAQTRPDQISEGKCDSYLAAAMISIKREKEFAKVDSSIRLVIIIKDLSTRVSKCKSFKRLPPQRPHQAVSDFRSVCKD